MRLKRLIVHGFKSFKDRTTIHFDDGITGIVGPNGCGKSNIVDALFWVMGEQSAKHLRGSNMKDLIFSGSDKYTPGAWAEVTLVLDNDDKKHIHIGNQVSAPSEIQITRKLYRNSETEYRINNSICRLRDIQEVFMDTGAGAKSYSIIAQGEINRLVQSKPEERRVMIEEVAGITKFKVRKRESLRKIEQTVSNLNRLHDLQAEIDKNIRVLQNQAEKARKARDLKQKIEANELIVDSHREYDLLKNYREGKTILTNYRTDLESWSAKRNVLELSLEDERIRKDDLGENIEALQQDFNQLSKELAASEERLTYLKKSSEEKNSHIETRTKESEELKEEIDERNKRLATLVEEEDNLKSVNLDGEDFSDLEEQVEELKEQVELKDEQVTSLREDIENLRERHQVLGKEEYINTSKLEELENSSLKLKEELEELEESFKTVTIEMAQYREDVDSFSEQVLSLSEEKNSLQEEINQGTREHQALEQKQKSMGRELIEHESRLESLRDLNESLEGIGQGASKFLKSGSADGFALIGSLIKCESRYTKAVSLLLSELLEVIVSQNESLDSLEAWFEGDSDSSIEFLEKSHSNDTFSQEGLISLADIVQISSDYEKKLRPLLERFFIGDTSAVADGVLAIASEDGTKLIKNIGGSTIVTFVGTQEGDQGMVARNNRIQELSQLVESKREALANYDLAVDESAVVLQNKIERHEEVRDQLVDIESSLAVKKAELEKVEQTGRQLQNRVESLTEKYEEGQESQIDLRDAAGALTEQLESMTSELDEKRDLFEDAQEELNDLKSNYEDEREILLEKQIEAKSYRDRMNSLVNQIEDIKKQIKRQEERLTANSDLVQKYSHEVEQLETEIEDLSNQNMEKAGGLAEKETILNDTKHQYNDLLAQMQEREDEVKKLSRDMNKADKKIVEFEIKLEQFINDEEHIVRNIFEKYQIDLRDTIGKFLDYSEDEYLELRNISSIFITETEFGPKELMKKAYLFEKKYDSDLKERISRLKRYRQSYNQLGEINWQSIDDYERQKKRSDFLKEQESELNQSIQDLQSAIEQIDAKSRERFSIAFEEVNERFEKVFPIIFGGGNAKLKVIGDITDIECGVDIIAQPPGKKMQNINLMSGGEKAMTAVSLIFSIFLVKPSPFCLLDEVDAPLDDANVGRFNELLREMSSDSQFILITHNKKTMEMNDTLYGITMQEPGISKAVSVQLH